MASNVFTQYAWTAQGITEITEYYTIFTKQMPKCQELPQKGNPSSRQVVGPAVQSNIIKWINLYFKYLLKIPQESTNSSNEKKSIWEFANRSERNLVKSSPYLNSQTRFRISLIASRFGAVFGTFPRPVFYFICRKYNDGKLL